MFWQGGDPQLHLKLKPVRRISTMAYKIAFFNHKGGVSKTTTVFNLGWMLASKGKKVILVELILSAI
jgi:Mrp family chromosome partitioning ATPase